MHGSIVRTLRTNAKVDKTQVPRKRPFSPRYPRTFCIKWPRWRPLGGSLRTKCIIPNTKRRQDFLLLRRGSFDRSGGSEGREQVLSTERPGTTLSEAAIFAGGQSSVQCSRKHRRWFYASTIMKLGTSAGRDISDCAGPARSTKAPRQSYRSADARGSIC